MLLNNTSTVNAGSEIIFAGTEASVDRYAAIGSDSIEHAADGIFGNVYIATKPSSSSTTLTRRLVVKSNGNVGIGTTSPSEKLEVAGAITVGNTAGENAGTIRWTGTAFEGYNGTGWVPLGGGGAGGAVGVVTANMSTSTSGWLRVYNYTAPFDGTAHVIVRGSIVSGGNSTSPWLKFAGVTIDGPGSLGANPFTLMGSRAIIKDSTYQISVGVGVASGFGTSMGSAKVFIIASK